MEQLAFDFDVTPEWVPIVVPTQMSLESLLAPSRDLCRDCGVRCAFNQGGAGRGVLYQVCDECAKVDSCRLRCCTPVAERRPAKMWGEREEAAHCDCGWWLYLDRWDDDGPTRVPLTPDEVLDLMAEHARPRHVSHWGASHLVTEHDDLIDRRERRRAAYRKRVAA